MSDSVGGFWAEYGGYPRGYLWYLLGEAWGDMALAEWRSGSVVHVQLRRGYDPRAVPALAYHGIKALQALIDLTRIRENGVGGVEYLP